MAKILLEPFQNVAVSSQAQLTTQRIWPNTLEYIMLVLGSTITGASATGFLPYHITNLQVRLGQKTIWYVTGTAGTQLDCEIFNQYENRTVTSNVHLQAYGTGTYPNVSGYGPFINAGFFSYVSLDFANWFARSPKQQYLGAIDMGSVGVRCLTILATISSAVTGTLTMGAYAEVAPPKTLDQASNLLFRAILQTPLAPSGATVWTPFLINYGQSGGALLRRLYFANQTILLGVEVKRDGLDIYEQIASYLWTAVETEYFHTPQASNAVIDFIEDNIESKALTSVRADSQGNISLIPQIINLSHGASGTYNCYADVFANLNGL